MNDELERGKKRVIVPWSVMSEVTKGREIKECKTKE
jgi:hypothetical protein